MLIDLLGKHPKVFGEMTPELLIIRTTAECMTGPVKGGIAMAKTRPVKSLDFGVNLFSVKPQLDPSFADTDLTGWMFRFSWVDQADYLAGDKTLTVFLVTLIKDKSDAWSCWISTSGPTVEFDLPRFDVNAGVAHDARTEAQLNPTVWNRLDSDEF